MTNLTKNSLGKLLGSDESRNYLISKNAFFIKNKKDLAYIVFHDAKTSKFQKKKIHPSIIQNLVKRKLIQPITSRSGSMFYSVVKNKASQVRRDDLLSDGASVRTVKNKSIEDKGRLSGKNKKTEKPHLHPQRIRETSIAWLKNHKGRCGQPFLTKIEIEAVEHLVTDFEAAQLETRVTQNWERFLVPVSGTQRPGQNDHKIVNGIHQRHQAQERVRQAIHALGPELSDVVLRACCCFEGLEVIERDMGWCARSGKVVLKLGLQRLARYYQEQFSEPVSENIKFWRNTKKPDDGTRI
jgi:hypothetical protein